MKNKSRSMLRALAAGLGALVCLGAGKPAGPETLSRFERERARMMLKIIREDLEKYYYDTKFHGVDLDTEFATANAKIDQADSNAQCFAAIARPLLSLKDSHTFFLPPPRSARFECGWRMKMLGDRAVVTAVEEGSDAAAKGLKVGDLISSIDAFTLTRENLWGVNYVYRALAPREKVRLKVQSPGESQRDLEIATRMEAKKRLLQLTRSADVEDYIHDIEGQMHIGRHQFQALGDPAVIWKMPQFDLSPSEVRNYVRQVEKYPALILDLRGNPGGAVETLEAMVGSFLDGETRIGDVESRERMKPIVGKASGDAYKGRLIVLIDSQSASASELFARVMQIERRATVLGDRSAGAVMMSRAYSHEVGSGTVIVVAASITIANIIMKDGHSLENTGVVPDEIKLATPESMAAGRDPLLAYAASLCGVTLDPQKAGSFFPVEWEK